MFFYSYKGHSSPPLKQSRAFFLLFSRPRSLLPLCVILPRTEHAFSSLMVDIKAHLYTKRKLSLQATAAYCHSCLISIKVGRNNKWERMILSNLLHRSNTGRYYFPHSTSFALFSRKTYLKKLEKETEGAWYVLNN